MALRAARADPDLEVVGLLTTVDEASGRVAMHDVRGELLRAQAAALALPLHVVGLPWPCPNDEYEARMGAALEAARAEGVSRMVFGDVHLADVRAYREERLAGTGIDPVFPLWGSPTAALAGDVIDAGVTAVLACVDTRALDASFVGRPFDRALLADLPATVDPCGENGELHTVVTDGPGFARRVAVRVGATSERDGFARADVIPVGDSAPGV